MKNQLETAPVPPFTATPALTEARIQQECIMWFNRHYRALSDLLFHIPNGGFRNAAEAARLKAQGVKAGVPDLLLACPSEETWPDTGGSKHHGLFIELKTPTGTLSKEQKAYHKLLAAQGYRVEVVRSLAAFQELLTEYLA